MKIQDLNNSKPGFRPSQAEVVEFLHTLPLGVVSTLTREGQPQTAFVAFSETPDLELIIGTATNSHKAQNIEHDPRVAFNATDPERRYTVQFEGRARRLTREAFDAYADRHFEKLPASAPFRDVEGQCYIMLEPTHVCFTDCTPYPWVTTEFDFE